MANITARTIEKELKELSNPAKKKASEWFFKTGKGQYGYGDKFIGVTVPEQRSISKKYKDLEVNEIEKLLSSPIHECRLTALFILIFHYNLADTKVKKQLINLYVRNFKHVNNWDLVDASASYLLGDYLLDKDRKILYKLGRSDILWERRIAIVATQKFIKNNDFADAIKISEILLDDSEDLMHKAVGWTLREMGKKSIDHLRSFLDSHADIMPRTMLRYSLEKLDKNEREHYMQMKSSKGNQ